MDDHSYDGDESSALTIISGNDVPNLSSVLPASPPLPSTHSESETDNLPDDAPILNDWNPAETLDDLHTFRSRPPMPHLIPCITYVPPQVTISLPDVMANFRASILPFIPPRVSVDLEAGIRQFEMTEGIQLQGLSSWSQYHESQTEPLGYTSRDSQLQTRDSYPFHLHNFVCLEDEEPDVDPLERAANLIYSAVGMIRAVRRGTFNFGRVPEPEFYRRQYASMFVPDWNDMNTPENYSHIVIMVKGQMYALNVLRGNESDLIWNRRELVLALRYFVREVAEDARNENLQPQVGIMTTVDSSEWTATRARIAALNPKSLWAMDSAMFVVCLDSFVHDEDFTPQMSMTIGSYSIPQGTPSGSCFNRWHVGKLQLVVPKEGRIFVKFDEICIDRQTAMRFAADMALDADVRDRQTIPRFSVTSWPMWAKETSPPCDVLQYDMPLPKERYWKLQWDSKIEKLSPFTSIHAKLKPFREDVNMAMETFTSFGSVVLVGNGVSPDSFFQVAAQLAMVWLRGNVCTAKEVVTNTDVGLGCTSTVWSSTMEVRILAALFYSDAKDKDVQFRLRLACQQHERLLFQTQNGFDWMKYLQFLEFARKTNGMARVFHPGSSFFDWPVYDMVKAAQLTTYRQKYDKVSHFCATPETNDGVSVSYAIRERGIHWTVCTTFGLAEEYLRILWNVMERLASSLKAPKIVLPPDLLMAVAQNDIANFGDLSAATYKSHTRLGVRVMGFDPNVLSVDVALEPTEVGEASSGEDNSKVISDPGYWDFV